MVSYEVQRRIFTSFDSEARNTVEARKQRRGLLRFAKSDGRLTGMPLLGLLYPSTSLARHFDPRRVLPALKQNGELPSLDQLTTHLQKKLDSMLQKLTLGCPTDGPADEAWYWAAPILLDQLEDRDEMQEWWEQDRLLSEWSAEEVGEDSDATRFEDHLDEARKLLRGELSLGRPPDDLSQVLAQLAIAGPGICS